MAIPKGPSSAVDTWSGQRFSTVRFEELRMKQQMVWELYRCSVEFGCFTSGFNVLLLDAAL
ncbi:hypothetical protein HPP92_015841 [Vanilla planifolia]|uniref:Uncharacterized protein n=1 Tax=Vanilla planifolia TaxID=51239 RepID=A0A835QQ82_VANPL|nr:hypothetical protein HPP92_015841 [Vanilla planifolia]